MRTRTIREDHPARVTARTGRRRRAVIVSSLVVILTLVVAAVAADRVAAHLVGQRIAERLAPYGEAEVEVQGVPVLTQLAAGRLDSVQITMARARYKSIDLTGVDAQLFDVPTDASRPIGTVDAQATLPVAALDAVAAERAALPAGMAFASSDGQLALTGTLLGQEMSVDLDARAESRRILVTATTLRLGGAEVDLSMLPGFLTSAITDIVIDLEGLPAGLEVTGVDPVDDGLRVSVYGSGVRLSESG